MDPSPGNFFAHTRVTSEPIKVQTSGSVFVERDDVHAGPGMVPDLELSARSENGA